MSKSEESLLKAISHYQNGLERYLQRQDEAKMLHNLGRLYKLPIKVCHLEKTGVGRTVNSLRKVEGEVGEAAKSLVARWKEMVVQEEENEAVECSSQDNSYKVPEHREESQSASHINTNEDRKSSETGKSSSERYQSSKSKSHSQSNCHEKKHKEKNKKRSHSSSEEYTDDHEDIKNSSSHNRDDIKKQKIKQNEQKSDVSNKDSHKSNRESKNKSKQPSDDDESAFSNHKSKTDSKHESNDTKKHHHKSSHSCKEEVSKNKMRDEKKHDSSKHDKERKKDHKERESKDQREEKHEKHKKSKHSDKTPKSDILTGCTSSSSKKNEKSDKNKLAKSATCTAVINGIGSESGTSFEDALGMCGPPPNKKKKLSQQERQKYSSPVHDNETENYLTKETPSVLPLPKDPLENLDINISSLLPPITPHYRPLGLPVDDQPKKMLTDDEALSRVMMNKNQRTKVYSGNKVSYGKIPTLFDICVRILQDNIDALEYTGGVPYSILKPILEKATANQLYMLEHHNPYLIEDSDELWKLHCQTEFRNKKKEEMETWRDMYMRCLDEREAKLRALTANIKQSQDKSLPVRTTKLAYVDSVAKPPRNIARKQAKNDTNSLRPSAKLATLATKGEAAKVSVPNPGARAAERTSSGSSHPVKAKKAPLMAKTLTAYKNRFRR